jgi:hypothetical protein
VVERDTQEGSEFGHHAAVDWNYAAVVTPRVQRRALRDVVAGVLDVTGQPHNEFVDVYRKRVGAGAVEVGEEGRDRTQVPDTCIAKPERSHNAGQLTVRQGGQPLPPASSTVPWLSGTSRA